jgi:hypothetical protein
VEILLKDGLNSALEMRVTSKSRIIHNLLETKYMLGNSFEVGKRMKGSCKSGCRSNLTRIDAMNVSFASKGCIPPAIPVHATPIEAKLHKR